MGDTPLRVLLDQAEIATRVERLADVLAEVDDGWTVVALLQGAIPFAADLMRASESSGKVVVRADISRDISGRPALIIDDVFDSGRTIAYARAHLMAKGAARTMACAFVRKPQAGNEPIEAIGYGMDAKGRYRGLPFIAAI